MCQCLFKLLYHSTIFKFSFRNGDKVMSALRVWQYLRERKTVKLHSWLFYGNPHLLFLITIKNTFPLFFSYFSRTCTFQFMQWTCESNLGWMAVREHQGNPLLVGSCTDRKNSTYSSRLTFISCKLICESKECL